MSTKIVIANWKMNPASPAEARRIYKGIKKGVAKIKGVDVVVCPPTVYLPELAKEAKSSKAQLGVQDVFYEETGAQTGQTSPAMVKPYKAKLSILGHSERRVLGESHELVGRKAAHAIEQGLTAVVCVGETDRNEEGEYYNFVRAELEAAIVGLKRKDLAKLVVAYEPIWAIGKRAEEACDTTMVMEMVLFIRKVLTERFGRAPASRVPVLYGGSVKANNASSFLTDGGANGLLVGGASLKSAEFVKIVKEVASS